jgi:hypothetical protein
MICTPRREGKYGAEAVGLLRGTQWWKENPA